MAGSTRAHVAAPNDRMLWPTLSILGIGLVYLFTFPRNYTEAEDAVFYVDHVDGAIPLWHGNHLLYEPLMYALYRVVQMVWSDASALVVMQMASFAAVLLTLALVARIVRLAGGGAWSATIAVWLLAGCFAFWLYGMYPDTYILPLPLVLMFFLVIRRLCWDDGGSTQAVQAGILMAAATLLHQSHVFLVLPGLIAMTATGHFRLVPLWLGVAGTLITGAYLWVGFGLLGHANLDTFLYWARGFAADGLWTPFSVMSPVKAVAGLGTAIWSSLFLFAAPGIDALIEMVFPGRSVLEEKHFADTGLMLDFRLLAALTTVSVVTICALALRALLRGGPPLAYGFLPLLGMHAATYAAITTIWEPANKEFWIAALPFLVLLVVLRLDPARRWLRRVAVTGIATLWLANSAGAMLGFARAETDYWLMLHAELTAEVRAGDVVVDNCGYICTGYMLLFSPAELLGTGSLDLAAETGPGRILLTSRALSALDAAPPLDWLAQRETLRPVINSDLLSLHELPR